MRAFLGVLANALLLAPSVHGQVPSPSAISLWLSGTRAAPIETREGLRHDRAFAALGLRAAWPLFKREGIRLEYAADLTPAILATANRTYRFEADRCDGPDCDGSLRQVSVRYTTVGFGVAPIGFQLRVPITSRLALTTAATVGALYFLRPVPDYEAARLNFMGEIGGSVEIAYRSNRVLALGYRLPHISNAGTAPVNVGLNSHLLTIGLAFPR
jgi:hypothetical protein